MPKCANGGNTSPLECLKSLVSFLFPKSNAGSEPQRRYIVKVVLNSKISSDGSFQYDRCAASSFARVRITLSCKIEVVQRHGRHCHSLTEY